MAHPVMNGSSVQELGFWIAKVMGIVMNPDPPEESKLLLFATID